MALMDRPRNSRTADRQRLHGEREGKQRYAAHPQPRACERKARFATADLARDALSMLRRADLEHGEQHVYHCPSCARYHYGGW